MSPSTPTNELQKLETDVKKVIQFGLSHMILVGLLALSICGSIYLYDSKRADQADSRAAIAQTLAQQEDKQNVINQQQNQAAIQALALQNNLLQTQIGSLAQSIATRDNGLVRQQGQIRNLQPPELATRWGSVANEPAPTVDSSGNFTVPLPLALKSVDALITVPVLQADIQDQKTEIANQVSQLANSNKALSSELAAHQSDNATCQVDKASLNSQLVAAKADARKGKFKWFGIGVVVGLITGHFAGF